MGFFVDRPAFHVGSHSVDTEEVAEYVGHRLSDDNPASILFHPEPVIPHKSTCQALASQFLNLAALPPSASSQYVSSKTVSLVDDFPEALRRHPLRKLDLLSGFQTYVAKLMED